MKSIDQPLCKREILDRLARLRPDSIRHWGKMTASQMTCHLNDSLRGVMDDKPLSIAQSYYPRKLIKWIALYLPVPWPHGVPTPPEMDALIGGTPPAEFEMDREDLRQLLDRFTRQPRPFGFQPHPMFLEMSEWDWMRWAYLHTDHHFRQFGI
jgi:hypothetical protein